MKFVKSFSWVIIFWIGIAMILAVAWHQKEDASIMPNQIEYYFNEGWQMGVLDSEGQLEVNLPYAGKVGAGTIVFRNTIPMDYAGLTMNFSSVNARVGVFLDGEEIYLQEQGDHMTAKHIVDLPNTFQEGRICIVLTILDQYKEMALGDVFIETRDVVLIGLVGSNIADIACCLLILISSIILFVIALIRWYTGQSSRGELFLGLFGLTAGVNCFIGTDTLNLFLNVQNVYVAQGYLLLLLPLLLNLYFERNMRVIFPRRFSILLCAVLMNAGGQLLLQVTGQKNLDEMIVLSKFVLGVVCMTAILSMAQFDGRSRRCQTLFSVLSMAVLLTGELINVIMDLLYQGAYGNAVEQYSMTAFAMMMTIMHIIRLSKEYRANAEERIRAAERQNILLAQAKQEAEEARQEALAANEAKGKFLAHMSHEIRTPINAVLGMDEMILREAKEQNIREYAMDIYTAGQSLLALINDILDFSKIESGKMEIVPMEYDISSLIHDLVSMISQRAADKNLRLEVEVDREIPSRLYGDDVRIRQVLTNILTNAVKYTPSGTVWLRVQGHTNKEMEVLGFEVEDTGIGIKEEDLPKLSAEFERFEKDRNRNIEGCGLGMSITLQLLELLGSRLEVESEYGKGSKFSFTLEQKIIDFTPVGDFASKVRGIMEHKVYQAGFHAPEANILVVDDNAVNRKVFRNLLKETRIQVTEAHGGAECLRLVQQKHYDVIFLDHMMPEMDGVETLHYIRTMGECPCQDTPVVVLTANAVSGAKEKYLSEGFDDFLSKPIMPEKLENMLISLLPEELLQTPEKGVFVSLPEQTNKSEICLEDLPMVEGVDWNYAALHLPDMELLQYTVREFYDQIDSAADFLEKLYTQITGTAQLEEVSGQIVDTGHLQGTYGYTVRQEGECAESLKQYRIQVHAMKGLAATVGIVPLAGIARVLESGAKDGKIEILKSMTTIFLKEWRSYRVKLRGVLGIGCAERTEMPEASVLKALLEMVRISMGEMDFEQADQLMLQLRKYQYPEAMEQGIQKLAEAVTNLDLEEVEHLVVLLTGFVTE